MVVEKHRGENMAWRKVTKTPHFFPNAISCFIHCPSTDSPSFPQRGYTPWANYLPFCSQMHSLHAPPFLRRIIGNHISQTCWPSGFHVGSASGKGQQKLGGQAQGGSRSLCTAASPAQMHLCPGVPMTFVTPPPTPTLLQP